MPITCTYDMLGEYGRNLNNTLVDTPIDEEQEGEEDGKCTYEEVLEPHGFLFPVQSCLIQGWFEEVGLGRERSARPSVTTVFPMK